MFSVTENTGQGNCVAMLTNWLGLISRLELGRIEKLWVTLLNESNGKLIFVWVSGHAGITYDEMQKRHPQDIVSRLKDRCSGEQDTHEGKGDQNW